MERREPHQDTAENNLPEKHFYFHFCSFINEILIGGACAFELMELNWRVWGGKSAKGSFSGLML